MNSKNNSVKINYFFLMLIVFLFGLISLKIIYIATSPTVDGIDLKEMALNKKTASKKIVASRGIIYDALGEVLAQDVRSYTVIAYLTDSRTTDEAKPRHVIDKQRTAEELSELINMTPEYILELLNNDVYQVELGPGGRGITELRKQQIENLELPGIDFIPSTKRDYPYGDFASYIIGYARKNELEEITGEMGIEAKYNEELKGIDGSIIYQRDAYGYQIADTPETVIPAVNGYDIHLTIDSNIQMYLENAILEFEEKSSDWATITIADAKTGAIVASSSSPSFNPNVLDIKNYNNPLTSYVYEPGSTMKIFSFMAAIEHGLYEGDELYESGSITVDKYTIRDWNRVGWGEISYDTGFTYSSNTATVLLAQRLGREKLTDFYEKLGFAQKTGIELPNEYSGVVEMYADSELASAGYGQGITTTPIQNIQALTSITNGGTTLKPYIISKIVDPSTNKVIYEGSKTELNKVASKETIEKVIEIMDETVNGSDPLITGGNYHTDKVRLIGKTGTAQYITEDKIYSSGSYNNIRSFSGIFPKEDPQYIIFLSTKDFYGSSADVSEITKKIVESIAKYKNIEDRPDDTDKSKIIKVQNYINQDKNKTVKELENHNILPIVLGSGDKIIKQFPLKNTNIISGTKVFLVASNTEYIMPDIIGWNSSEIKSLAHLINLSYNIDGYGKVTNSSINPGDLIDLSSTLEITLE